MRDATRHSFDIADTSDSFHTPDSRESNATISMVSDIESFAEETNVRRAPAHFRRTRSSRVLTFARTVASNAQPGQTLAPKVPEHVAETVEKIETQLTVHDIHERPTDVELRRSDHRSERYVQCERNYQDAESPPDPSAAPDEVTRRPEASSMNEHPDCRQKSAVNAIDSGAEGVVVASDESERLVKREGESNPMEIRAIKDIIKISRSQA